MKIPIFVFEYNGKSLYPVLRTKEIPTSVLRTVGIPISVIAYNWIPYMRYCVRLKSLYPLLRTIGLLMNIHIPKIPGSPAAAAKIANQILRMRFCLSLKFLYPLLRTMEIPISVLRTMEIPIAVTA